MGKLGCWCGPLLWVVACGLLVGCGSAEERKASYVEKANVFIQEGNFPKARVALRNAIKIDPKDPHLYFLAGQVFEKEANWPQAFRQFSRVVELDATHREAIGRLARFYLAAQESTELMALSHKILTTDSEDVLGRTIQACAWFLDGEHAKALAQADVLVARQPTEPDLLLMLAVIFSANQDLKKAQAVLQRGLSIHPENGDLLNYLATISIGMKDYHQAEGIYRQLLAQEPHVVKYRETLAGLYRHLGQSDKAMALLREGVTLEPENEQRWKSLILSAEGDQQEALIQEALGALPDSLMLRFLLGAHYEQRQNYAKAREIYEAIATEEETSGQGLQAEVELAKLDLVEQDQASAQTRIAAVLKENPRQSDALLLKGKLSLVKQEPASAVDAFRIVLKDEPNNSAIQSLLGQAHLLAGEFELARESLEKAVSVNARQVDAYTALARLSAREGQIDQAQQHLEALLQVVPTHFESLWTLFRLQLAQRHWSQSEQTIVRLQQAGASGYQINLATGLLAAGREQWEVAAQAFARAQQANAQALPPLAALVNVFLQRQQPEQAMQYLQSMLAAHPDHPFAWGLLGAVFVQLRDMSSALSAYRQQTEVNPAWVEPWRDWAMVEWSQGQKAEAITILNRGLSTHPQSLVLLSPLATFYQAEGHVDLAMRQYELILAQSSTDLVAANNLAYLLADKKGDPRSLEKALALAKQFEGKTDNPILLDTLAWVYYKMGLFQEAISLLKNAVVRAPDHGLINYHLGLLKLKVGDRMSAKTHLEKSVRRGSDLENIEEVRRLLAEIQS